MEYWLTSGLDMLNSEPYGCLTYAYAAEKTGYPEEALEGRVLGARNLIPTVARLVMPEYIATITAEGDPLRAYVSFQHFRELLVEGTTQYRGSVAFLSTSKGVMPELALGYKLWTPVEMDKEQRGIFKDGGNSSVDLNQRLILGWNRDSLLAIASGRYRGEERGSRSQMPPRGPGGEGPRGEGGHMEDNTRLEMGGFGWRPEGESGLRWQSGQGFYDYALLCVGDLPVFLSDWTPAEYVSGNYQMESNTMDLVFKSHTEEDFSVKLYSHYQPAEVKVNGEDAMGNTTYNPKTGWMLIKLNGSSVQKLQIKFGQAMAPLHPYFTGLKR
jgi:hypothetical protein